MHSNPLWPNIYTVDFEQNTLNIRILVIGSKYYFNVTFKLSEKNSFTQIFFLINGCYGNRNMKWLKVLNYTQKAVFESKLSSFYVFVSLNIALTKISDYYIIQRTKWNWVELCIYILVAANQNHGISESILLKKNTKYYYLTGDIFHFLFFLITLVLHNLVKQKCIWLNYW